jgi:hypothetical protein
MSSIKVQVSLAGDVETGVSVMRVEREMDAGPSAIVRRTPIGAEETTGEPGPFGLADDGPGGSLQLTHPLVAVHPDHHELAPARPARHDVPVPGGEP